MNISNSAEPNFNRTGPTRTDWSCTEVKQNQGDVRGHRNRADRKSTVAVFHSVSFESGLCNMAVQLDQDVVAYIIQRNVVLLHHRVTV